MIIVVCATLLTLFKGLTGEACLGMFIIGFLELLLELAIISSYLGV